jgi:hypothetical protein
MVLFIAYIILALLLKKRTGIIQLWDYFSGVISPFGTFYVEKYCKMFKSAAKIFEFLYPF